MKTAIVIISIYLAGFILCYVLGRYYSKKHNVEYTISDRVENLTGAFFLGLELWP